MKKDVWMLTIEQFDELIELASKHGKKAGDDMSEEFLEIKKKHNFKYLGNTNKDIDLLTGDLREQGLKILNLHEEERKRKLNEEKTY